MTNSIDPGKVQSVLDVFDRMDADNETAAPDDDPDFDDTAGPDDLDDDVAGAELDAEEGDTGDIRALQRRGRHQITLEEARALQMRARAGYQGEEPLAHVGRRSGVAGARWVHLHGQPRTERGGSLLGRDHGPRGHRIPDQAHRVRHGKADQAGGNRSVYPALAQWRELRACEAGPGHFGLMSL